MGNVGRLSSLGEHITRERFREKLDQLNRKGHASTAIMTATRLENWLEEALKTHFKNKPRSLIGKLFNHRGPLGTFSSKIDMAYAIGAISKDAHRTLHVIRDIRNVVAHADDHIDFHHQGMDEYFAKLPRAEERELSFLEAAVDCINNIKDRIEPIFLARAVEKQAKASREKSR